MDPADKHGNPDRAVGGDPLKQSSEDMRSVYAKPGDRTRRKANMALKLKGGNTEHVPEGLFPGTVSILFKSLGFIISVRGEPLESSV